MGQTLRNTWVGVLLCTAVAMVLTVGCLPKGTCYRHYLVIASTTAVALTGVEAAKVVVAVAKALALRVPALAGEGPLLLATTLLELLFPTQSVAAWLEIFLPLPST
jgi:hypothetical protein